MRMVHDLVSDMVGTRTGAHGRTHDGGDRQMHDEGDNRQREGDVSAATGGRIPALVMRMCAHSDGANARDAANRWDRLGGYYHLDRPVN